MNIEEYEKELREIANQVKPLLDREKEIKSLIVKSCDQDKTTKYGGITCQIVPEFYTLEFNQEKFMNENKELYERYLEPSLHKSQIRVVLSKEKGETK